MRFLKSLILIVALSFVACKSDVKRADAPRRVKCESAQLASDNFETGTFPGRVVAATDVNLGFRVAGIVDEIPLADGAYVRKGDVIARLDSRDYALQLQATQAEYDAIKAEVDRVVALYADESVSANDYDKATNGLRQITAKLEAHKNALSDTELRAPFNGYIQKSNFGKGEAVAAGTPVVAIISSSTPEVTVDIPAAYYLKQSDFQSATAVIDLYADKKFNLKLKGVTPKANLNQLYKMTFTLEGTEGIVPSAGMSAMVEINYTESDEKSLIIPFSAIVESDGVSEVWVVADNKVQKRQVKVLEIKSQGGAVVQGELSEGELVVSAG
ncbi:MAG: efflux RND transporter periplasmic adaptor subunit, partial [Rikenellaceae bacterium]